MKSSTRYGATSAAAFFALCASVVACGPGGGNRPVQSYPTYPPQYSTERAANVPVNSPFATAPQVRITVVSATTSDSSTASDAPVGQLHIASPAAEDSTAAESAKATKAAEATAKTDLSKSLDSLASAREDTSKIADAIKGLVGTWMAVSRQGDGGLSTVELQLDDHGWAKLTVPGADGKPSTTNRKVEFDNNELKLTGADADVMLGKLVDFNSRQMVLERSGGQVTFVRP